MFLVSLNTNRRSTFSCIWIEGVRSLLAVNNKRNAMLNELGGLSVPSPDITASKPICESAWQLEAKQVGSRSLLLFIPVGILVIGSQNGTIWFRIKKGGLGSVRGGGRSMQKLEEGTDFHERHSQS